MATPGTWIPRWLVVAWMTYLGIAVSGIVALAIGAKELRLGPGGSSVHRYSAFHYEAFIVNERFGLRQNDAHVSLVTYAYGTPPLRPLCGTYVVERELIPVIARVQGDWYVSSWPWPGHPAAVNVVTGEELVYEGPAFETPPTSASQVPILATRDLSLDGGAPLDLAGAAQRFPPMDCVSEDCVVQSCGLTVVGILLLGVTGITRLLRRRLG